MCLQKNDHIGYLEQVLSVCPVLASALHHASVDDSLLILATVQHLVHIFGPKHPEQMTELILVVAESTNQTNADVRGSALTCMAAFLREMGIATLPYLPQVKVFSLLQVLTGFVSVVYAIHLEFDRALP